MTSGSLARRYARAVFDYSVAENTLDAVGRDLLALGRTMDGSSELVQVLTSPATSRADRRGVIHAVAQKLGVCNTTVRVLDLLLDADRILHVPAIAREVAAMATQRSGHITAEITSATPLSADQMQRIVTGLERISGKKVQTTARVDADLLGGVSVKMGDTVYDGSLRAQLSSLQTRLSDNRAN